ILPATTKRRQGVDQHLETFIFLEVTNRNDDPGSGRQAQTLPHFSLWRGKKSLGIDTVANNRYLLGRTTQFDHPILQTLGHRDEGVRTVQHSFDEWPNGLEFREQINVGPTR